MKRFFALSKMKAAAIATSAFLAAIIFFAPAQQAQAGGIGLSLNIGKVGLGLGIGCDHYAPNYNNSGYGDSCCDGGYAGSYAAAPAPAPAPSTTVIVRGQSGYDCPAPAPHYAPHHSHYAPAPYRPAPHPHYGPYGPAPHGHYAPYPHHHGPCF